jgi:hypothetical protein
MIRSRLGTVAGFGIDGTTVFEMPDLVLEGDVIRMHCARNSSVLTQRAVHRMEIIGNVLARRPVGIEFDPAESIRVCALVHEHRAGLYLWF